MKRLKQFRWSVMFMLLASAALMSYQLIGSHIDAQGFLVEPFGLIPIFWLCLLLAIVSAVRPLLKLVKMQRLP